MLDAWVEQILIKQRSNLNNKGYCIYFAQTVQVMVLESAKISLEGFTVTSNLAGTYSFTLNLLSTTLFEELC